MEQNLLEWIAEFPAHFAQLGETLIDFINTKVDILGNEISIWAFIGGAGLLALLIFKVAIWIANS